MMSRNKVNSLSFAQTTKNMSFRSLSRETRFPLICHKHTRNNS